MPAVSSICCKCISADYKCTAKARQTLLLFWEAVLGEYKPTLQLRESEQPEELEKLNECFEFLGEQIYRDFQNA